MGKKADPPPEVEVELGLDPEWVKVRRWREKQYLVAGIEDFVAFRLALVPDVDWHKVVAAKAAGLSDHALIDLFLDY